jgi:hypothetical protein
MVQRAKLHQAIGSGPPRVGQDDAHAVAGGGSQLLLETARISDIIDDQLGRAPVDIAVEQECVRARACQIAQRAAGHDAAADVQNQDAAGVEVEDVLVVAEFALDNLWLECAL